MELRQLGYFVAIARHGSISKAAADIHIAQPALSHQLANLETELGVQLLKRHSRGVTITEPGRQFLTHAHRILGDVDRARRAMQCSDDEPEGEVRLGMPTTTAGILAVPLLQAIQVRYPRITLNVIEGMSGHLSEWLEKGSLDVALLFNLIEAASSNARPLLVEDLYLIGPRGPNVPRGGEIDFHSVCGLPLVVTTSQHILRQTLDDCAHQIGSSLNICFELDSLAQMKILVSNKLGYTILPLVSLTSEWKNGDIETWRIVEPSLHLNTWVQTAGRTEVRPVTERVVDLTFELTKELVCDGIWQGTRLSGMYSDINVTNSSPSRA